MAIVRTVVSLGAAALGFLAVSTGAHAQSALGAPLFAVLNGGNECDGAAVCQKGDVDAIGSATISLVPKSSTLGTICWGITADNLAGATVAHIHRGVSAVNGGILVHLTAPSAPSAGNPGSSSGCRDVGIAVINAIRADPTSFYVNVHNGTFTGGAIRGQLH